MRRGRFVAALALGLGATAFAEAPVGVTRAVPGGGAELSGWLGTTGVGLGVAVPAAGATPVSEGGSGARWSGELQWAIADRTAAARLDRVFGLAGRGLARLSGHLGAGATLVPAGAPDLGFGPHAGLLLRLGNERLSLELGLQTGAEVFAATGGPRFFERAHVGATLAVGAASVSVVARGGVDLEPGRVVIFRGEALMLFAWRWTAG